MKIERISETDYKLYIYSIEISQDNNTEGIKKTIKKMQKKLKLKGFYKVIACYKEFGLFLQLIKLDDSFYHNTLDLRITYDDDLDIYFKTKDYFILDKVNTIKYYDNFYYGLVDNCYDWLIEKVEFGEIIFGYDINELLDNAIVI